MSQTVNGNFYSEVPKRSWFVLTLFWVRDGFSHRSRLLSRSTQQTYLILCFETVFCFFRLKSEPKERKFVDIFDIQASISGEIISRWGLLQWFPTYTPTLSSVHGIRWRVLRRTV
ncbi:hypothetical protein NPIL_197881, partial [Nephila pilipes]